MNDFLEPIQPDIARRADELLQRLFDRECTETEGHELFGLWKQYPALEEQATDAFEIEQLIRFREKCKRRPLLHGITQEPVEMNDEDLSFFENLERLNATIPTKPLTGHTPRSRWRLFVASVFDDLPRIPFLKYKTCINKKKPTTARKKTYNRAVWLIPVFLLTVMLVAFLEFRRYTDSRKDRIEFYSLAQVTSTADLVNARPESPLRENRRLNDEPVSILEGTLEMCLENGVRIAVEGPAEFRLTSAMNAFCGHGRLSVHVPPQAKGFEVATPNFLVRDLGTDFVVDVTEAQSELHVIDGLVEANWLSDDWVPFKSGLGISVAGTGKTLRLSADRSLFIDTAKMHDRVLRSRKREKERHEARRELAHADPSVLVSVDFNDSSDAVQKIGCRTTFGRLPGLQAAEFRRNDDVALTRIDTTTKSLTLTARLCVDRLDRVSQSILTSTRFDRGAIQWQLNRDGTIQLLVSPGIDRLPDNYLSDTVLSPNVWGVWIHLATVFDAKRRTVSHYLDGKCVGTTELREAILLKPGDMEIGNWRQKERVPTSRVFGGAIQEITLFNRALSEYEIQTLAF